MDEGFIFGSSISIWDMDENERVKIGIGMCKDSSIVLIYEACGMENYRVVLMESMNEDYDQWKLFCLIPSARYCKSKVGIKVFWPCKYLSMNDEVVKTSIK
jgi:hypothetical protein